MLRIITILLILGTYAFAQNDSEKLEPILIDRFGTEIESQWKKRFDLVINEQKNKPDHSLLIVIYTAENAFEGLRKAYLNYLLNSQRGFCHINVSIVYKEFQVVEHTEIWLMPPNAKALERIKSDKLSENIYEERDYSKAKKIGEFNKIGDGDFNVHFSTFLSTLLSFPKSKGYIFLYGKNLETHKTEIGIKAELNERCGLDCPKIRFIYGGFKKTEKVDLWLVEEGGDINNIKEDKPDAPNQNLFERIGKVSDRYFNLTVNGFAQRLSQHQSKVGFIVIYGTQKEIVEVENKILRSNFRNSLSNFRYSIIHGGYKKQQIIEFWIVPNNINLPTLSPESITK